MNYYGSDYNIGTFYPGTTSTTYSINQWYAATVHTFVTPYYSNGTAGTEKYVGYWASGI